MQVVYVDVLFGINGAVDYLLLLAAARIAGVPLRRRRCGLAAAIGGAYAVAIVLPGGGVLERPFFRLLMAGVLIMTAYAGNGAMLRCGILFLALSCALAGGMLGVCLLGRDALALENGVIYTGADVRILLVSAAACYAVSTYLLQKIGKHSGFTGEIIVSRLYLKGETMEVMTLIDTGNTLTDPVSGKGVMVVEGKRMMGICPVKDLHLRDPAAALTALGRGEWAGRFRLLPFRSVGVDRGLLLAVRVDRLVVGNTDLGPSLVALSPNPVSECGGYQALVGPLGGREGIAT